jgi:hypothetical protein
MVWTRPSVVLPKSADFALLIRHTFAKEWSQRYLLIGDAHHDSHECYLKLLKQHLDEARQTNALIIDNGDFFDAIVSANDPRGGKGGTLHELNKGDYLDALVDQAFDLFEPYADLFVYFGFGNHESKILARKETNLTRRLVEKLNAVRSKDLAPIHRAGYTGWIRFMFETVSVNGVRANRSSEFMKLEHGTGGNSPVTKGVIGAQRRQVRTHGATFFVTSHIHESWQMNYVQERPNLSTSRIELHKSIHVQLGSYKSDFRHDGSATWAMEKMGDPKPVGGAWLKFYSKDGSNIGWNVTSTDVDYPNLASYLRLTPRILRDAA